jgi:hypothetical protein
MRGRCVSERNPPEEKSSVVFGSVRRKSNNFLDTKIIGFLVFKENIGSNATVCCTLLIFL